MQAYLTPGFLHFKQGLGTIFLTMKYSKLDLLKILAMLMSTVLLYLSIQELRVALSGSQATAETLPCTTPTPSGQPSATPSATPSPTATPTPLPTGSVFLTEFMACPTSGNEWLELYNANETTIEVTGWQVIDISNNKKTLTGTIQPRSFTVFEWTGSLLNNTGDSFKVVTTGGQIIGEASYEKCTTGVSFVYEDGEWVGAVASPNQPTTVSENTATTATTSAFVVNSELPTGTISSPQVLAAQTSTIPQLLFPYQLPKLTHTTPSPTSITSISQPKRNTASAISVILGGLLQLAPASYAIYDTFFKSNT